VTGGAVWKVGVDEKFPLSKFGSAAPAKKTVLVKCLALEPDPTLGQRLLTLVTFFSYVFFVAWMTEELVLMIDEPGGASDIGPTTVTIEAARMIFRPFVLGEVRLTDYPFVTFLTCTETHIPPFQKDKKVKKKKRMKEKTAE